MKTVFSILWSLFFTLQLSAQNSSDLPPHLNRDGKFMIESGYNVLSFITTDSGLGVIFGGGTGVVSLGGDMGYFLSNNFALKGKLGLVFADGSALITAAAGGKYYLAKRIPVEATVGVLASDGGVFQGALSAGYSARLADNILLEPAIGVNVIGEGTFGLGRVNFVMLF